MSETEQQMIGDQPQRRSATRTAWSVQDAAPLPPEDGDDHDDPSPSVPAAERIRRARELRSTFS
jgi:hypothetical protein